MTNRDLFSCVIQRSRDILAHPDPNVSSRILDVGYVVLDKVNVIVDFSSNGTVAFRVGEGESVETPTLAYNGRSGKYPLPHLACDKAKYMFYDETPVPSGCSENEKLAIEDGNANARRLSDMYINLIKSFYEHSKLPALKPMIAYFESGTRVSFSDVWDVYGLGAMLKAAKVKVLKPMDINMQVYVCGKALFSKVDVEFREAWGRFLSMSRKSDSGFDVFTGKTDPNDVLATKLAPLGYGMRRSSIISLTATRKVSSDGLDVTISDKNAVMLINGFQDLLDNNSRVISGTGVLVALTDSIGVVESDTTDLCLNAVNARPVFFEDGDLPDADDDINGIAVQDALKREFDSISPYMNSLSRFTHTHQTVLANPTRDVNIILAALNIMPKGNASVMGVWRMSNAIVHIIDYGMVTKSEMIYYSKVEKRYRVTEFTPTITDVVSALSTHNRRTSGNSDVRRETRYASSYAEFIDLVQVIASGKGISHALLNRMATQAIRDLSAYGFDYDMKKVLATVCAVYNNVNVRNGMEKKKLQLVSHNIGQMFAIGATVAAYDKVIGTDKPVMDRISGCIDRPVDGLMFVHKSIVSVYLNKFDRVSPAGSAKYRAEIAMLFDGWSVDDIDCKLDKAAFLVGFYQRMAKVVRDRNEAIERKKLDQN
jgi:hypothetical protein